MKLLLTALILLAQVGCSTHRWAFGDSGCKNRAYIQQELETYIRSRSHSPHLLRTGIIPFEVPAMFSAPGSETFVMGRDSVHFGRQIAEKLQGELLASGKFQILELFNEANWPGKRDDFFTGNYGAIDRARRAGYDFVLVGYLHNFRDDGELKLSTRLIDLSNNATVFYGESLAYTNARQWNQFLADMRLAQERRDDFRFEQLQDLLAECTAEQMTARTE